jgi:hypothetical protein
VGVLPVPNTIKGRGLFSNVRGRPPPSLLDLPQTLCFSRFASDVYPRCRAYGSRHSEIQPTVGVVTFRGYEYPSPLREHRFHVTPGPQYHAISLHTLGRFKSR